MEQTTEKKTMKRFTKYYLSVIGCFSMSLLLFIFLQNLTGGEPQISLLEAIVCYAICLVFCAYMFQEVVFKYHLKTTLSIVEFIVAHSLASSVWQLMINSMVSHGYFTWFAVFVPSVINIVITYNFYKDVVFNPERKQIGRRWTIAIIVSSLCIPLSLQSFASTVYHVFNAADYSAFVTPTQILTETQVKHSDGIYEGKEYDNFKFPMHWEDEWFLQDLTQYNPDLANIAGVLSSAAYYYSLEANGKTNFSTEEYWGALGFEWINVTSFRYRSDPLDKFANLLTGDSNGAAYVVAGKDLVTKDGSHKKLIVVSICGSLNFDFADDLIMNSGNIKENGHASFLHAANELATGLTQVEGDFIDDDTIIFICGHSRGGAIANLLAVELEEILYWKKIDAKVCAYTFACPNAADAHLAKVRDCDTVFNIINPYDLVTMVPFEEWDYSRYGTDVLLFDKDSDISKQQLEEVVTLANSYNDKEYFIDYSDKDVFNASMAEIEKIAGNTLSDLRNPFTLARLIRSFLSMKPRRYISSHRLPIYISWLSQS